MRSGMRLALVTAVVVVAVAATGMILLRYVIAPFGSPESMAPKPSSVDGTAPSPAAAPLAEAWPGEISGLVVNARGEPLPGAKIVLKTIHLRPAPDDPQPPVAQDAVCGGDGAFQLESLPLNRPFGLYISHEDAFTIVNVELTDDRPRQNFTFALDPAASVSGHVRNATGNPVAGVAVRPYTNEALEDMPLRYEGEFLEVKSGDDGHFAIRHVWPMQVKLIAHADGYPPAITDWILPGSDDVEIVLSKGVRVSGTVVDAQSNAPVENVRIHFVPVRAMGPGQPVLNAQQVTAGEDGAFVVEGLQPGAHTVSLIGSSLVIVEGDRIDVRADEDTGDLVVKVREGGRIAGRVLDAETNEGIAGATVMAMPDTPGKQPVNATSGADGTYTLMGLPEGAYTLNAHAPGPYRSPAPRDRPDVSVSLGQTVERIDIKLIPSFIVAGRVIDSDGNPVAEAAITGRSDSGGEWPRTVSNEEGLFSLAGLPREGSFYLQAQKDGYAPANGGPFDPNQPVDIELVMQPGGSIMGTVVDTSNKPLDGMRVIAEGEQRSLFEVPNTLTDWTGMFELKGLSPGTYGLRVSGSAQRVNADPPEPVPVTVEAGETVSNVRLVFERLGKLVIAGRVLNAKGDPIPDASIVLTGNNLTDTTTSDDNGYFQITGLPAGEYMLRVQHAAYSSKDVTGVKAGDVQVEIKLEGTGTVEGQVIDASTGQPVTAFSIAALGGILATNDLRGNRGTAYQDPEGFFRIANVQTGPLTMVVSASGYLPERTYLERIAPDSTLSNVRVALKKGASVFGHVRNVRGEPVAGAAIYRDAAPLNGPRSDSLATTGPDGKFELTAVSPGPMTVWAGHPDYAPGSTEITVPAGGGARAEIVLTEGGSLVATVLVNGKPDPTAFVGAADTTTSTMVQFEKGDAPGTFVAHGLAEGTVHVTANVVHITGERRGQSRIVSIESGRETEVNFDLVHGTASLRGEVLYPGRTVTGGSITIAYGDEQVTSTLNDYGAFEMNGLSPGVVNVTVSANVDGNIDRMSRALQAQLTDGRETFLQVELEDGASVAGIVTGASTENRVLISMVAGSIELPATQTMEDLHRILSEAQTRVIASTQADASTGAYRVSGVQPGDYTLVAIALPSGMVTAQRLFAHGRAIAVPVTIDGPGEIQLDVALPE